MPPYNIVVQLDAFTEDRANDREDLGHRALLHLLDFMVTVNRNFLRKYPKTPDLYKSGVRYEYETPGVEEWQDIPTTLKKGYGDCEDLACWRVAELQQKYHVPAQPVFRVRKMANGGYLYHILVRDLSTNKIEDPSKMLGMR
jgi:hypothetical protein